MEDFAYIYFILKRFVYRDRKLITRGSGAGSPNYVSPDVSKILHDKLDILPWRLCKGDFTKYVHLFLSIIYLIL